MFGWFKRFFKSVEEIDPDMKYSEWIKYREAAQRLINECMGIPASAVKNEYTHEEYAEVLRIKKEGVK